MLSIYNDHMRIHHLRALSAVADKGTFTGAAATLGISQSSLSHAIAGLEHELDIPLVLRGRRGAQLTEIGQRVLVHARQALASLESIRAETDGLRGALSGRIRVGSIPSATVDLLPKVMAQFSRRHPAVELTLLEEPSQGMRQLLEWLREGTIDLALLEAPVGGVAVVPLLHDELRAIVSSRSPLARHGQLCIRDLAKEPFILSRYSTERLIHAAYAREGLAPAIRFELQDLGTLVSMVREGLGISIVPKLAFPAAPPGVRLISISPRIRRQLGYAVMPSHRPAPAVQAFIEALREVSRPSPKRPP